jgi:arsenical pump membrane protein
LIVILLAITAMMMRPFRLPEYVWAACGALVLCVVGLLPWPDALHAVARGNDVYLFLCGMMIAAELAYKEGVFDFLAGWAVRHARESGERLFLLVYAVGVLVTVLMSNDATVVVLTPAVLAVTRAARVERPLPYLYACAFVANAASFVLPISNPANLVIFRQHLPSLTAWLARFALPSLCSIVITYLLLRWCNRSSLSHRIPDGIKPIALSTAGKCTAWSLIGMAAIMLTASALAVPLGWPTFMAGIGALVVISLCKRRIPFEYLADVTWSILPLVAGLFVMTEALERHGAIALLAHQLQQASLASAAHGAWAAAAATALASNIANNLPVGMLAGAIVTSTHLPQAIADAILIGIDLGPNLSITGSLATLLWVERLRREGMEISAMEFLKIGAITMLPAMAASVAASLIAGVA